LSVDADQDRFTDDAVTPDAVGVPGVVGGLVSPPGGGTNALATAVYAPLGW
jgi:hypothetical protein